MLLSDGVHTSNAGDSLDRRIASLRKSVERESRRGTTNVPAGAYSVARRLSVRLGELLERALRLADGLRFDIGVYAFAVAISLLVGWLIASKL